MSLYCIIIVSVNFVFAALRKFLPWTSWGFIITISWDFRTWICCRSWEFMERDERFLQRLFLNSAPYCSSEVISADCVTAINSRGQHHDKLAALSLSVYLCLRPHSRWSNINIRLMCLNVWIWIILLKFMLINLGPLNHRCCSPSLWQLRVS